MFIGQLVKLRRKSNYFYGKFYESNASLWRHNTEPGIEMLISEVCHLNWIT